MYEIRKNERKKYGTSYDDSPGGVTHDGRMIAQPEPRSKLNMTKRVPVGRLLLAREKQRLSERATSSIAVKRIVKPFGIDDLSVPWCVHYSQFCTPNNMVRRQMMMQKVHPGIEESMRRSSIPTSIPLFQIDFDCDEVSVVTTETYGAGTAHRLYNLPWSQTKHAFPHPLASPSSVQRLLRLPSRSSLHA